MKRTKAFVSGFCLILAAISFASCDFQSVTDTYHRLPDSGWNADSVQTFNFEIKETAQNHNIYFNIRNDRSYGFSNLWLFVKILSPEGVQVTDTIQVMLAGPSGKWLGKGFAGIYTSQVPYRTHVYFPQAGNYSIQLMHGMRPEVLKGLTDVGIRIEKTRR